MVRTIEKVTAFITRRREDGHNLLLIEHPYAGIQIPAGTVKATENPEQAILRETFEETGLTISSPPLLLDCQETYLAADEGFILPPSPVYARPDARSFNWICIQSGVQVEVLRKMEGFMQITYIEHDQVPNSNYVSMQITGWVSDDRVAQKVKRHFFHIKFEGVTESSWKIFSDHHTFTVFWAPIQELPVIIPPQDTWLKYLIETFDEEI